MVTFQVINSCLNIIVIAKMYIAQNLTFHIKFNLLCDLKTFCHYTFTYALVL